MRKNEIIDDIEFVELKGDLVHIIEGPEPIGNVCITHMQADAFCRWWMEGRK